MASTPNPAVRLHLAPGCIRKDEAVEPMITSGRLRKTMKPAQLPSTIVTLWLFNIAMENGPFIDGVPIKNGDFPWLC